ncbi:MAG TPA: VanZ family protein [Candidatus Deferrimicrobiaceae bacterium]|jgi:VanZ family protein
MSRTFFNWRPILPAAIVVLILIATLRPFDFRFDAGFTAMRMGKVDLALLPVPEHESLYIDAVQNLLLFFPLGAALFLGLVKRRGAMSRIAVAIAGAAFLSFLCETLQIWLPTRYPQVMDVGANTLGAFSGAVAAAVCERIGATVSSGELRRGLGWNIAGAAAAGAVALILLVSAVDLDPVRSVRELEGHAKAFIRSPWFDRWSFENATLPLILLGVFSCSFSEWIMDRFPSLRTRFTYLPVFLISSILAILFPLPRIFFRSFAPNWGAIAFGLLGNVLGIAVHRFAAAWLRQS